MNHTGTQTIETPRLTLRQFVAGDAEAMYTRWARDPEVTRYMSWMPHQNLEETRSILGGWLDLYATNPGFYNWAVTLKSSDDAVPTLIGSLGILYNTTLYPPCEWEPGYCLAKPYWGQGYATEALRAALDYFIGHTGLTNMFCCHATANPASGVVMSKVGFVYNSDGIITRLDGTTLPAKHYIYSPKKEI